MRSSQSALIAIVAPWIVLLLLAQSTPRASAQQICAGHSHVCMVRLDNTAVCWGITPSVDPPLGVRFSHLACGYYHSCGISLDTNQTLCWGLNAYGATIVPPAYEYRIKQLSCGQDHSCGVDDQSRVICWGRDNYGQVSGAPVLPGDGLRVYAVAAGFDYTCVLQKDESAVVQATSIVDGGGVRCWGHDNFGVISTYPAGPFVQMSCGYAFCCAIRSDGTLACWGQNDAGQANTPGPEFLHTFTQSFLATAGFRPDGTIWAQGLPSFLSTPVGSYLQGGLGFSAGCFINANGQTVTCRVLDSRMFPPTDIVKFSCGQTHGCGIRLDSSTVCWGAGWSESTLSIGSFSQIFVGASFTCAFPVYPHNGTIYCYGTNNAGGMSGVPPGNNWAQLSLPSNSQLYCARDVDGHVRIWGQSSDQSAYDAIKLMEDDPLPYKDIRCANIFACGLYLNGALRCWGASPFNFTLAGPFSEVAVGDLTICVIIAATKTGTCQGDNTFGQRVFPSGQYRQLTGSGTHFCAIRISDSNIKCWGSNTYYESSPPPGPHKDLQTGLDWSCAIATDTNRMNCWGNGANENTKPPTIGVGGLAPAGKYRRGSEFFDCPLGRYSAFAGAVSPICTGPCQAGAYGNTPTNKVITCNGPCPEGHYCPANTVTPIPCPAGYFGSNGRLQTSVCSGECFAGYFCPPGTVLPIYNPCPAGRYGAVTGLTNGTCSGLCAPGYWCPPASTSPTQLACGSASVYCPANSSLPLPVPRGYYSIGGATPATNFAIAPCPAGSQCVDGVAQTCIGGTYSTPISDTCSNCPPGKFSLAGAHNCTECATGLYSSASNSASCTFCAPGLFANITSLSACFTCDAGTYSPDYGFSTCVACSTGSYNSGPGSRACHACTQGNYANLTNSLGCTGCPAGTAQLQTGRSSCDLCLAGKYAAVSSQSSCQLCDAGFYAAQNASLGCEKCGIGLYNSAPGQSSCDVCPGGSFSAVAGSTSCTACAAGTYGSTCVPCAKGATPNADRSGCAPCAPGTFAAADSASSCTLCPDKTFTPNVGSQLCFPCPSGSTQHPSRATCICDAGSYATSSDSNFVCEPCSIGADCSLPGSTALTLAPSAGYWRPPTNASIEFIRCLVPAVCLAGGCAAHRTGPLCSYCEPGYQAATVSSECTTCPSQSASAGVSVVVVIILVGVLFLIFYAMWRSDGVVLDSFSANRKKRTGYAWYVSVNLDAGTGTRGAADAIDAGLTREHRTSPSFTYNLKIFLSFFQVVTALLLIVQIPWPSAFAQFISYLDFVNMQIVPFNSVSCVAGGFSYYDQLLVVCFVPVGILFLLGMVVILPMYVMERADMSDVAEKRNAWNQRRSKCVKLVFVALFLMYPGVSSRALGFFVCKEIDGEWYLQQDFTLNCYTAEYTRYTALAVMMIIAYTIGIPLLIFTLLWHRRRAGRMHDVDVLLSLGFLFDAYTAEMWWWELLDSSYKLIMTSMLAFFPSNSALPFGMAVTGAYMISILVLAPYVRLIDDRLHLLAEAEIFLLLCIGWVLQDNGPLSTNSATDVALSVVLFIVLIGLVTLLIVNVVIFIRQSIRTRQRANLQKTRDSVLAASGESTRDLRKGREMELSELSRSGSSRNLPLDDSTTIDPRRHMMQMLAGGMLAGGSGSNSGGADGTVSVISEAPRSKTDMPSVQVPRNPSLGMRPENFRASMGSHNDAASARNGEAVELQSVDVVGEFIAAEIGVNPSRPDAVPLSRFPPSIQAKIASDRAVRDEPAPPPPPAADDNAATGGDDDASGRNRMESIAPPPPASADDEPMAGASVSSTASVSASGSAAAAPAPVPVLPRVQYGAAIKKLTLPPLPTIPPRR